LNLACGVGCISTCTERDGAERPGVRHSRRECWRRGASHRGLDEWKGQAESLDDGSTRAAGHGFVAKKGEYVGAEMEGWSGMMGMVLIVIDEKENPALFPMR
jgi:hypothetical protein